MQKDPEIGLMNTHTGAFEWHDDDCLCVAAGRTYCNRNGHIWSCCGRTEPDANCGPRAFVLKAQEPASQTQGRAHQKPPIPRWSWTGRLQPGRRRTYEFSLEAGELVIPYRPHARNEEQPVRPEQAMFLDQQHDLLKPSAGGHWRVLATDGLPAEWAEELAAELARRLEVQTGDH